MASSQQGTIARLVVEKGFGFIRVQGSDTEYFFHRSAVQGEGFKDLQEGDPVTFAAGEGPKGPRAEGVSRV